MGLHRRQAELSEVWESKISTWNVFIVFSAFLSDSACGPVLILNVITKKFNEKNYVGMVQKFLFLILFLPAALFKVKHGGGGGAVWREFESGINSDSYLFKLLLWW